MPGEPIHLAAQGIDLSDRVKQTTTIVASPAAAAETIVATLPAFGNLTLAQGILLLGWAAYTVGTSGTAVQLRVRQTNIGGTVVANTGALTGAQHGAGILSEDDIQGFDTAAVMPGQVYVLTMQVTAGAAPSTLSAVQLVGIAI